MVCSLCFNFQFCSGTPLYLNLQNNFTYCSLTISLRFSLYIKFGKVRVCSEVVRLPASRCSGPEQRRTGQIRGARSPERDGLAVQIAEHHFRRSAEHPAVEQRVFTRECHRQVKKTLRCLFFSPEQANQFFSLHCPRLVPVT